MAQESEDDQLREMAEHRGFKLVRSRRRKAGVGDFGKFGLTDAVGSPLLGIGDNGLTATPSEIRDYLRTGAVSTWKQSAESTPDAPHKAKEVQASNEDRVGSSVRPPKKARRDPSPEQRSKRQPVPRTRPEARGSRPSRDQGEQASSASDTAPTPKSEPEPVLVIRPAKPADDRAIAALIVQLEAIKTGSEEIMSNLAAVRKTGGGVIVAQLGSPVGCCIWTTVQTVQRGQIGRLTLLLVDEAHRRQQIGTQLLAAAELALAKKGCSFIEVLSDIEITNSHNFFRARSFEQTSYRFARPIADDAA